MDMMEAERRVERMRAERGESWGLMPYAVLGAEIGGQSPWSATSAAADAWAIGAWAKGASWVGLHGLSSLKPSRGASYRAGIHGGEFKLRVLAGGAVAVQQLSGGGRINGRVLLG